LDGKKKVMSQFNRFMAEYHEYQITEDTIIDVLSDFAGWLCIQKKSYGDYFAPQTMTQYLSGVKEINYARTSIELYGLGMTIGMAGMASFVMDWRQQQGSASLTMEKGWRRCHLH
jgi:hypothetical protein